MGLLKARHDLDDSLDENLWIQKETRIRYASPAPPHPLSDLRCLLTLHCNRLINIMTLIDCAFSFFSNFPCRLTVTEMKFDLPCEEVLFSSQHPFSEPKFKMSRHLTTYEAFRSLFAEEKSPPSTSHGKKNPLGLNPLDMFILIHRMLSTY